MNNLSHSLKRKDNAIVKTKNYLKASNILSTTPLKTRAIQTPQKQGKLSCSWSENTSNGNFVIFFLFRFILLCSTRSSPVHYFRCS